MAKKLAVGHGGGVGAGLGGLILDFEGKKPIF